MLVEWSLRVPTYKRRTLHTVRQGSYRVINWEGRKKAEKTIYTAPNFVEADLARLL